MVFFLLTPYGLLSTFFWQILVPLHLRGWTDLHVHGRRFVWSSDSICVLAGYQGEVLATIWTRTGPQLFGPLCHERVFKDHCQTDGKRRNTPFRGLEPSPIAFLSFDTISLPFCRSTFQPIRMLTGSNRCRARLNRSRTSWCTILVSTLSHFPSPPGHGAYG